MKTPNFSIFTNILVQIFYTSAVSSLKKVNLLLVSLGLLSISLSYLKFSYCIGTNFSGLSVTSHGCYSDIPIFWNTHLLEAHLWPYKPFLIPEVNQTINPVEYPFLTGFLMWLVSYITPFADQFGVNFFKVNAVLIGLVFIICLNLLNGIRKSRYFYFAFAPAVVFSLFINWDIWAVASMLAAVYFFDRKKYKVSSLFLAISISFKFFPIVLLIPILILGWSLMGPKKVIFYIINTFAIFALINTPAALFNFEGWFYFYKLSFQRSFGSGSVWEILKLNGVGLESTNPIYVVSTLLVFLFFTIYVYKFKREAKLAEVAFYFIFAFVIFNKVYSPQYVIWLTSFGVLVLQSKKQKIFFAIWQFGELAYHFAIWQYLYWQGFGLHTAGISVDKYKWISLFRVITLVMFTSSLIYQKTMSKQRKF